MVEICNREKCCGCGACSNICPQNAIDMKYNNHGFLIPVINKKKCIECKLCQKVCPINSEISKGENNYVFAAKAKNTNVRFNSQSGGAFAVLARKIILNDGIVYGAVYRDKKVFYSRAKNMLELEHLKKSKYVQADLSGIFHKIENDLKNGKSVLFSGTPCYVAAISTYLRFKKINMNNFITIDLVCYGVPSPGIFKEYLELEEKTANKEIKNFVFRDKKWSLKEKYSKITWKDEEKETIVNGFLRLFSSKLAVRNSCCNCKFSNSQRISDITIGDYWGIEKIKPDFDDNRGVSVIICHTSKGKNLFKNVKNDFNLYQTSFEDAIRNNPALRMSLGLVKNQDVFWKDYEQQGLLYVMKKYADYETSCHVDIIGNRFLTKDKQFIKNFILGKIKNGIPNWSRPILRKLIRR